MEKAIFLDSHSTFGRNPDRLLKTALIGAELKWGLELVKFDTETIVK